MASGAEALTDSANLKSRELLKEVQLDYSPANTAIINDAVSAIREAINNIPDGLQVNFPKFTFNLFLSWISGLLIFPPFELSFTGLCTDIL